MVQYYRANLQPTMTPALSRESHHWSTLVDLLLEVARGVDLACQPEEPGGLRQRCQHRRDKA